MFPLLCTSDEYIHARLFDILYMILTCYFPGFLKAHKIGGTSFQHTLRYVCLRSDAIGLIIAYQPHDTTDFPDLSCTYVRENPEISKQFTLVKVDSEVN